jgi:hypothetical protein
MKVKVLSLLIVLIAFFGLVSCSTQQNLPTEPSSPSLDVTTEVLTGDLKQPVEDLATPYATSPITTGVWRFESKPEVVDGMKTYIAHVWFTAQDDVVILQHSPTSGIKSQDYGLCDQQSCSGCLWPGGDSPYLETKQGNRYMTSSIGCQIPLIYSPISLYPDIPAAGLGAGFYYMFQIPYREEPIALAMPGINSTISLPDILEGPFLGKLPEINSVRFNKFNEIAKANDILDAGLLSVNISDYDEKNFLAVVRVKIINHDPSSSFKFSVARNLIGENGFYWAVAENLIATPLDPSICPNQNQGMDQAKIEIPVNGEVETNFCFLAAKQPPLFLEDFPVLPSKMIYMMTLDDATLVFKGEPTLQ